MQNMNINWKNIDKKSQNEVESWLSEADRQNLCMQSKNWQETAEDISSCLKNMKNGQFRNVVGYINNQPAVALMFGVEHSGEVLNLYNIIVNPQFRYKGVGKQAVKDLINNGNKIFNLNKTYKEIKASTLPMNNISKKLFSTCGFSSCSFDGEYLVFTKYLSQNNQIEFCK